MNKEDLLKFTQLYQQLLMENDEYQRQNEELRTELQVVREELELLRQTVTYLDECLECCATPTYGGKNGCVHV